MAISVAIIHPQEQDRAFRTAQQEDEEEYHQINLGQRKREQTSFPGIQLPNPATKGLHSILSKSSEDYTTRGASDPYRRQYSSQSKKEKEQEDEKERPRSGEWECRSGNINKKVRGHWRPKEDEKLKQIVARYGPHNWNLIAHHLDGRSGKNCRLRWFNQLDPSINRCPFSREEEEGLVAAHCIYGSKWARIAQLFPGRTDNAVKNHWHVIRARSRRQIFKHNIWLRRLPSTSTQHDLWNSPFDYESFVLPSRLGHATSNNVFHHIYTNTNTNSEIMGAPLQYNYSHLWHYHHYSSECKTQSIPRIHLEHEDHCLANFPFIDFMGVATHVSSPDFAPTSSANHK